MLLASSDTALTVATWVQTIASLLGIIVAVSGIVIATRTFRDQRANRNFQSDRAYADEFERVVSAIRADELLITSPTVTADPSESVSQYWALPASHALNHAMSNYCRAVTNADISVAGYFTGCEMAILRWNKALNEEAHTTIEMGVNGELRKIRDVARDWVYPERRPDVMMTVYQWQIDQQEREGVPVENRQLQIDRWMTNAFPSTSRIVQAWRRLLLWVRVLGHDVRRGRLRERIANARATHQENRHMRKKFPRKQYPRVRPKPRSFI
jgi:hypothetical protein